MAARHYGGRSAQQRRSDRRARLLVAALDLIGTQGYAAATVEALCGAARVSTRTFYEEFGGRTCCWPCTTGPPRPASPPSPSARSNGRRVAARTDTPPRAPLPRRGGLGPAAGARGLVEVVGVSTRVGYHRLVWRRRIIGFLEAERHTMPVLPAGTSG
ncbi:MAG: TetR family transcriptional regulator [Pseudonocardiaceae bacterium]|nr:TetR family transcriptional regulator [Pseudonocardiaceae bacterium]